MLDLLLFLVAAFYLTATGRQIAHWLRLPADATALERNLIGFAIGLGLLSYAMLAAGLLSLLTLPYVLFLQIALLLPGYGQWHMMWQETRPALRPLPRLTGQGWGIAAVFVFFAGVALFGVYAPPTLLEWDSLAYHLADPNLYIQAHRIYYLPWESHSNFAFTAEMWYMFGLLVRGVPLAKFFHFACGVGTCLAIYAFGRRHLDISIGVWAAITFVSTPIVFWEAGTAYADLATTFFATLTLLAAANAVTAKSAPWLTVSAIMMGLTLSTKATALSLLAMLAIGVGAFLYRQRREWANPLSAAVRWLTLALAVGAPWYLKSAIDTGNPVYPFYFQLFGGRFWNASNAAAYDASNAAFGMGRSPDALLLVPWNLTMALLPGHFTHVPLPFNNFATPIMTLSPVLLASLFFPAFGRSAPGIVKVLGVYALAAVCFWCATAQHVRYLLPTLPVLCLLAAWVVVQSLRGQWLAGRALALLLAMSLCFSIWTGLRLASAQAPVALGQISTADYLARTDYNFPRVPIYQYAIAAPCKTRVLRQPIWFLLRPFLPLGRCRAQFVYSLQYISRTRRFAALVRIARCHPCFD